MNILYISNYDAHRRIAEGWMPSHHIFGMGEIIECFDSKASAIIKQEYGGGKVDFLVVNNPSKMVILHLCLKIMGGDMT